MNLPVQLERHLEGKEYTINHTGMSGSEIRIYSDCVLKIEKYCREKEDTVRVMRWLKGKLPVPEVLSFENDGIYQYLLMTKATGKMACDPYYLEHPRELLGCLAEAFRMLWSIDTSNCPRVRDLDTKLREAAYRVRNHLIDLDNVEPSTFGEGGFKDPEELLRWLESNRPEYEPVLSHGDFCLPNIFLDNGKVSGMIDLGDTGIGDKWGDIALCYRSLKHNFDGTYGGKVYPDFCPDMLFDALGIESNPDKLKYFILLDELF